MTSSRDSLRALRKESVSRVIESKESDNFTSDVIKNLESEVSVVNTPVKEPTGQGYKLVGKKKESKHIKRGFVMTQTAFDNINRYASENGYQSVNDFVNDLFEHLYDVL